MTTTDDEFRPNDARPFPKSARLEVQRPYGDVSLTVDDPNPAQYEALLKLAEQVLLGGGP